jgi:RHS repeat-associated protein
MFGAPLYEAAQSLITEYTEEAACPPHWGSPPSGGQAMNLNGCQFAFEPEDGGEGYATGTLSFTPPGCGPITFDLYLNPACEILMDPHRDLDAYVEFDHVAYGQIDIDLSLDFHYATKGCSFFDDFPFSGGHWDASWTVTSYGEDVAVGDVSTQALTFITDHPGGTASPNVSFSFEEVYGGLSFECSLDEKPFESCASPKAYSSLSEGSHTFRVNAPGDETPVERTFMVIDPPETTIVPSTPSYKSGDKSPIKFVSHKPKSTFKCVLDGSVYSSCTSPYSLPSNLSAGWHTFKVYAIDEKGLIDKTPAKWTFNQSIYQPAPTTSKLISPEEGAKSASHLTLKSEWAIAPEGGVSSVAYQLKHPSWDTFEPIPSEYLRNAQGDQPGWSLPVGQGPAKSPPLFLDLKAYAEAEGWDPQVEGLKLRAVFNGSKYAAGASEPVTVTYSRFAGGPGDAATGVGPATVNLVTGAFTMSRTDVSIPVPGTESTLEFTRTYNSAYGANEKTNSKTLSQMWQPSAPVESEYEGAAWQKLLVQHRPSVPAVYDKECWDEEGEPAPCGGGCPPESCEEWMAEAEIPEANWVEVLDNEGAGIPFDRVGTGPYTYVAPEEAKEFKLTKVGSNFVLADANGTKTEFSQNGSTNEYQPSAVSFAGSSKAAQLIYEVDKDKKKRLKKMIAPAPEGVTCNPFFGEEHYAVGTPGCRTLVFGYNPASLWGGSPSEERLEAIYYHNASGSLGAQTVSRYSYNAAGQLAWRYDPRASLLEQYQYVEGKLTAIVPSGEEPWTFAYYPAGSGGAYEAKLKSVSRASLLENPATATTTIAYEVPTSGEGAPYDMAPSRANDWGQADYPVDATAIFPPDQVPSDPPSDYDGAAVRYMDPDGHLVNTASAAPPGIEGDAISTSETDEHGNVVRSLGAQARLDALVAEDPVARAKELDSHSTYNATGTRMLESWGPLHEVRLESGETVEARAHTQIEYDKGAPEPKSDETWPNLPTKETTGAAIPGVGGDKDVRVTQTEYDWGLRKSKETIIDPTGLNLRTKTIYGDANSGAPGLVVESRQPSDTEGKDAGTTVSAYYSAGTQSPISACRNKPQWAGLPCVSYPKADPSPEGSNPKLPWTWITSYNSLDLPTETQEKVSGELKRTTTATYDAAGRPVESHKTGEGIETPPSKTLYSATGAPVAQHLVCEKECEGFDNQEVSTTYDSLGRPIEYEDADGNVSEVGYDLLGRPAITYDGKGTQTAIYDPDSGVLTQMTDSAAGTFTATYDADGKMLEGGLPNGLVAQASYDPSGAPIELTYQQTYCSAGCTWLQFEREASIHGQVLWQESTIEGAFSSQAYAYDKASRLTLVKDTDQGQCTTRAYSFDKNTNRTKLITRDPKEGGACDTESAGEKQEYGYDTADRLIGEGVEYDNLGRIIDLPGKYAGGGDLETSYYTSDLTHTQTQDGITNTYELDATGRQRKRIRVKGEEESTEIYHYASPSDGPAWVDLGESWTRNIRGLGGLGAIQDSATEDVVFQLSDMHGDVVATADDDIEATELLSVQSFDEYGNPKEGNPEGELTPKFGWLGAKSRRTELPSGVIQMGVRSYVPALGRFLTRDPVFGGSANAYEYGGGDPVNGFDLTGERLCTEVHGAQVCGRDAKQLGKQVKAHKRRFQRERRAAARASRGRRTIVLQYNRGGATTSGVRSFLEGAADKVIDTVGGGTKRMVNGVMRITLSGPQYEAAGEAFKFAGKWGPDRAIQAWQCGWAAGGGDYLSGHCDPFELIYGPPANAR